MSKNKYCDLTQLEAYTEKIKAFSEDKKLINEFITKTIRNLALRTLTRAIKLTPVQTGTLRRGWLLEEGEGNPSTSEVKAFSENLTVTQTGKGYSVTLINPIDYAVYVNYGHRQEVGRYVPAIKKRLKKGWVEGHFFLEATEEWINSNKKRIIAEEYAKFIKRTFKK